MRLVNKKLSAVAATVLWSHLEIDIARYDEAKLHAFLDSAAESVLCNAKRLEITTLSTSVIPFKTHLRTITNLSSLLGALPRDSLNTYSCPLHSPSRDLLGLLLRTQTQLRGITFSADRFHLSEIPSATYVRDNLTKLREIKIILTDDKPKTYRGLVQWFPHATLLRELWIEGHPGVATNKFDGWHLSTAKSILKLHTLSLNRLALSKFTASLAQLMDLSYLNTLCVENCSVAAPVLRSLAKRYQDTAGNVLKTFTYEIVAPSRSEREAFVEFLKSLGELHTLIVSV